MKGKRTLWITVIMVVFTLLMFGTTHAETEADLVIVQNGQAQAVVIIPDDADQETSKSADIFIEYVKKATGAELEKLAFGELEANDERNRIFLGENFKNDEGVSDALIGLDRHGFVIHFHDNHMSIVGPTVWGTRNGVYDFLERYLGITWLLPGEDIWEDVPQLRDIHIPQINIREEPDFSFRTINMGGSGDDHRQARQQWQERNRIQSNATRQLDITHNLHSLFPPEKYGASNPEFYPNGSPPPVGRTSGWQPCLSVEATIDVAIAEIIEYFDNNPHLNSYSLSPNDGGNYCETDPSHPMFPNQTNSVGVIHMSEIFFDWVNQVVEGVLEVYPDKQFGAYAYQNTMDPPSFPVHPNVVVVTTKDRMTWIDEDVRSRGQQHMQAWNDSASQMGWYEYPYGYMYLVPRVYPHLIAENYQFAKAHGVTLHHADMHQSLGDGPKPWIMAKLQWDADQDVDVLLDHWYRASVGEEAAQDLKSYFDLWEQFWTERVLGSEWFELGKERTYLPFNDAGYLNLVTEEDISESRRLLESVVSKAETPEQQERAQELLQQFEYYEASALSYPKQIDEPENVVEALDILEEMSNNLEHRLYLAGQRDILMESFKDRLSLRYPNTPSSGGSGWNSYEFWHLWNYMNEREPEGGPVTDRVTELAHQYEASKLREYARLLLSSDMPNSIMENPSFEAGNDTAAPWRNWIAESGSMKRVEGIARTGNASYQINIVDRGGPNQVIDVTPGILAARAYYYIPEGTETDGLINLFVNVRNADGGNLYSISSETLSLSDTVGEWSSIQILEELPELVNGQEVKEIQIGLSINGIEVETSVYVDDFVVYQNSYHFIPNGEEIIDLIDMFEEAGEIRTSSAARALGIHMTAISLFEKQNKAGKVIQHMKGFEQLLDHHKVNDDVTGLAYNDLLTYTTLLVQQYLDAKLDKELIHVLDAGDFPVSLTLTNHTNENFDISLESQSPEHVTFDITGESSIEAGQSVELAGLLRTTKELPAGEHQVIVYVTVGGVKIHALPISIRVVENLVDNHSFEDVQGNTILSWTSSAGWSTGVVSSSDEEAYTGERSLKISNDVSSNFFVMQTMEVEGGQLYELSAYLKANDPSGRARMKLEFFHDTNGYQGEVSSKYFYPTTEWAQIKMEETAPQGANRVRVLLRYYAPGTVYFDDALFRKLEE